MVRIKAEVIKCAEANRVSVLILRKSFSAPCDRACVLDNIPWCAAISSIAGGAVMRPARMLRRGIETNVADVSSKSHRHAERLNGTIQVLVIDGIFIMPDTSRRVGYFKAHKPNTIVAWIRFVLTYCRASPRHHGRLLSHGRTRGIKTKRLVNSEYAVLTVGSVVIHVALSRMTLAPGTFMRHDVVCLGKICRPGV